MLYILKRKQCRKQRKTLSNFKVKFWNLLCKPGLISKLELLMKKTWIWQQNFPHENVRQNCPTKNIRQNCLIKKVSQNCLTKNVRKNCLIKKKDV